MTAITHRPATRRDASGRRSGRGVVAPLAAALALILTITATSLVAAAGDSHGGGSARAAETPTATVAMRPPRPGINPVSPSTVVDPNPARPARDPSAASLPSTGTGSATSGQVLMVAWVLLLTGFASVFAGVAWRVLPGRTRR